MKCLYSKYTREQINVLCLYFLPPLLSDTRSTLFTKNPYSGETYVHHIGINSARPTITVGNQNGSFQRKYASPVPFGGRDGSFQRKLEDEDF